MSVVKNHFTLSVKMLAPCLSSLFFFIPAFANEVPHHSSTHIVSHSQLALYRQHYHELEKLLTTPQKTDVTAKIQQLLNSIKGYELYPFAEYRWLLQKPNLTLQEISALKKRLPSYLSIKPIEQRWLNQQVKYKNWTAIYANRGNLPKNIYSQCLVLQAQQQMEHTLTAGMIESLNKLWLTGHSLPVSCDPLLSAWSQNGHLSDQLLLERGKRAFQSYNQGLLRHLLKQAKSPQTKKVLNQYLQLVQNPMILLNTKSVLSATQLMKNPDQNKHLILVMFPRLVRSLSTTQLPQNVTFNTFQHWAKGFKLTDAEQKSWEKLLVKHFFDSTAPEIMAWRDKTLLKLKNDALFERRIRVALRNNNNPLPWIAHLSPAVQHKSEWEFWRAFGLLKYKNQRHEAHKIWYQLTKNRGFYPMLAAQMLDITYRPPMEHFKGERLHLNHQQEKELGVIRELHLMQENHFAALAWARLLSNMPAKEKLAMARYAEKEKWYDLQVEATILAKAWGYLPLRLPEAYIPWFNLYLKDKNIRRTFAMAIARQESAWRPQVKSHANAYGLMQLIPSTAKMTAQKQKLNYSYPQQLFDPKTNIMLGVQHLEDLYSKYGNNRILISAAYNAGPHRVDKWLAKSNGKLTMAEFVATIPYRETRNYVENVLIYDYYHQILQNYRLQKFTKSEYSRKY
ncbi:hypothetical protein A6A19_02175 [Actinobacillus delphinicola]|uniref:transglycosylase SLT domain-containing protein n=1 Tax=Actinobacillus delphinicola TaxID=51161 RepID=UPI0024436E89|nr:transglycosylase SLT domain-containing protein [Actinobacillus delphinicola]MDG6896835.1 hypothetical protein [Actinobacillus delphinicola]